MKTTLCSDEENFLSFTEAKGKDETKANKALFWLLGESTPSLTVTAFVLSDSTLWAGLRKRMSWNVYSFTLCELLLKNNDLDPAFISLPNAMPGSYRQIVTCS